MRWLHFEKYVKKFFYWDLQNSPRECIRNSWQVEVSEIDDYTSIKAPNNANRYAQICFERISFFEPAMFYGWLSTKIFPFVTSDLRLLKSKIADTTRE